MTEFLITRFAADAPRLIQFTSQRGGRITGRDVLRGGGALVRARDVLARHTCEEEAWDALQRVRAVIAVEDAKVASAFAAYARAQRRRDRAVALAAAPASRKVTA
jgi:hypothetical protein